MEALVHRPIGDLLEEIFSRGAARFPPYVELYPSGPVPYRIAVLVGGLCLGPEAEAQLRDRLTQRDSPEKARLVLGLGEIGHPMAEGHLVRVLREPGGDEGKAAALRSLGRIRGTRSLPLVRQQLDHPGLLPAACEALAGYGGPEATAALLERAEEFPAFRALCELGAPAARGVFLSGLERGPPWDAEAARGLGCLGDPAEAARLLACLEGPDPQLARAAFEAYARLGAPAGAEPLLRVVGQGLAPWMVAALEPVDDPGVHLALLEALSPGPPSGFFGRLFRRRAKPPADRRAVYRALRGAQEPAVVEGLLERLQEGAGLLEVREILQNRGLRAQERYAEGLLPLWREGDLLTRYLAARVLLQVPRADFLCEALDLLGRPGFVPLDGAPASADRARLLEAHARDHNPCLLLGGFVEAGFLDEVGLLEALRRRFASQGFPGDRGAAARFRGAGEEDIGEFLGALEAAHPGLDEPLARLWGLLDEVDEQGDRLLDLFLAWTGAHRGPLQRAVAQGLGPALARLVQGKTDRHLPVLDRIAEHVPREGPLAAPLQGAFAVARRTLQASCHDIALLLEGRSQRGDMVLIEEL
ncbi:MAG: HEAT repeat domain-containing protein [Thermodesulfobacteriota bacterium]